MSNKRLTIAGLFALLAPAIASAHEVYVLDTATIVHDIAGASPNPFSEVLTDPQQFIFWGIVGIILVSTVFALSLSHTLERILAPHLRRIKPSAAPIARITLGTCLIASAYNNALFGPEIPFASFGAWGAALPLALYVVGILITLGLFTRYAATLGLLIFLGALAIYHSYMLTYANYLGEMLFALIIGSGRFSIDHALGWHLKKLETVGRRFEPYAFPILRVLFGISVVYASYFAKYQHSQLALDVVARYNLTQFFPFSPLFTVLGACIVEILIGLFIIVGFEIRHTALFFLFWIFLSLLYFGESVWPHLVLVGVLLALFCHGYDRYSFGGYFFKRHSGGPVL